mmetsp:Transcript_23938/g.70633  ORF Transcript_23938/g.70633 Transcript_23938/m.70633 type:complete len:240 (-) Transcript_23938:4248-4967(-)
MSISASCKAAFRASLCSSLLLAAAAALAWRASIFTIISISFLSAASFCARRASSLAFSCAATPSLISLVDPAMLFSSAASATYLAWTACLTSSCRATSSRHRFSSKASVTSLLATAPASDTLSSSSFIVSSLDKRSSLSVWSSSTLATASSCSNFLSIFTSYNSFRNENICSSEAEPLLLEDDICFPSSDSASTLAYNALSSSPFVLFSLCKRASTASSWSSLVTSFEYAASSSFSCST